MREFGFTDHVKENWYFTKRVGDRESFNVTIDKESGAYSELVMDEDFGQPAYFGHMKKEFRDELAGRLFEILSDLRNAGLEIEVNPLQYGWTGWNKDRPLKGTADDRELLSCLRKRNSANGGAK